MPSVQAASLAASLAKESGLASALCSGFSFFLDSYPAPGRSETQANTRRDSLPDSGRKVGEATAQRATHTKTTNEPNERT
mmetsp:Transcript_31016/g.73589  ORF Transcript_31016/g.73589 Transcript_31016/m.73589 type:complete len:80 (-) Transcript_31016:156-395(-)